MIKLSLEALEKRENPAGPVVIDHLTGLPIGAPPPPPLPPLPPAQPGEPGTGIPVPKW